MQTLQHQRNYYSGYKKAKKLAALVILLLIHSATFSQSYYRIRTGAFDSLAYLAQKGKICDTVIRTQLEAISALQNLARTSERLNAENALQVAALKSQLGNLNDMNRNQQDLFFLEKTNLKTKIKKRNRIIIGEGLGIVVLIALIIL